MPRQLPARAGRPRKRRRCPRTPRSLPPSCRSLHSIAVFRSVCRQLMPAPHHHPSKRTCQKIFQPVPRAPRSGRPDQPPIKKGTGGPKEVTPSVHARTIASPTPSDKTPVYSRMRDDLVAIVRTTSAMTLQGAQNSSRPIRRERTHPSSHRPIAHPVNR